MTTSFDSLKKNRNKSLEKLNAQLDKMSAKSYTDPHEGKFWKPTRDKAGNGFAIIRFLPPSAGEEMPFVRMWDHGFQGPTGLWYIENSLSTINQTDPVAELNSKLWNASNDDESPERKQARKQKRRLKYVSNIYVIKDSGNPDNDGKVFLYAYGKKIFDKLNDLMNPQYEDETAVNPFDLWEGANFRLKIRQFEGYPNYDKSEFDKPAPLFEDDDEMEAVWKQQHSLNELLDPKHFKTYDELKAKLYRVLALTADSVDGSRSAMDDIDEDLNMSNLGKTSSAPEMKAAPAASSNSYDEDDDDDSLALFKELAKD
jgi:hypothetical protein